MELIYKEFITNEVEELVAKSSANKVAVKAKVSPANISQIRNKNWDHISDALWIKVKVNLNISWNWQIAKTQNQKTIHDLLSDAQQMGMSICISHAQGAGKTTGYKTYQKENRNVILVECKNYWSKKSFARHQLLACGLADEGTTEEMIEKFQNHLKKLQNAIVIYDQFDKLKEPQKDLFMDNFNELDENCAFVLSGVPHLKIQEEKGYKRNKMGYRERFSRYGSKFIGLDNFSYKDVDAICRINGISDKDAIDYIFDECENDGRRIKRLVQKYFLTEAQAA